MFKVINTTTGNTVTVHPTDEEAQRFADSHNRYVNADYEVQEVEGDVPSEYKLVVHNDFTHRVTGQTACNYDTYIVEAGEYSVALVDINHRPVKEGERPYYAKFTVNAILTERFYVNSLLGYSEAHREHLNQKTTLTDTVYFYQLTDQPLNVWTTRGGEETGWATYQNAHIVPVN